MKNETINNWEKGSTLKNGAILIDRYGDVVLCIWNHKEYVTWLINDQTDVICLGHYYADIYSAVHNFQKRCKDLNK